MLVPSVILRDPLPAPGLSGAGVLRCQSVSRSPLDLILVTWGQRATCLYDLGAMAVQKSWFPPTFLKVSTPMRLDTRAQRYALMLQPQQLLDWDGAETRLEQITPIQLKSPVRDLLASPDGRVWVLFRTGELQDVRTIVQQPDYEAEPRFPAAQSLQACGVAQYRGQIIAWYRFDSPSAQLSLWRHPEVEDGGLMTGREIKRVDLTDCMVGATVLETRGGPTLIYADRGTRQLMAQPLLAGRDALGQDVLEPEAKVVAELKGLKIGPSMQWAAVNPDNVALMAPTGSGASGSVLAVFNLRYGGCVARRTLTVQASPSLFCQSDRVMYSDEGQVQIVLVQDLPQTLAQVIAAQTTLADPDEASPLQSMYERVDRCLAESDIEAIAEFLATSTDVPELIILNIIECLVQVDEACFAPTRTKLSPAVWREELLGQAFSLSMTEALMFQYLGQLEFGTLLKMLEYLNLALRLEPGEHSDRFLALIQWTGLLLNAQYTNLLRAKEDEMVAQTLASLLESVSTFEGISADYAMLMPFIQLIEDKKLSTNEYANTAYCIEIIDL